jgi:hypothetical protein
MVILRVSQVNADDLLIRMTDFKLEDHLKKSDMATWSFIDPNGDLVDDERFEPDTVWEFRFGYPGDISDLYSHRVKYYEPVYAEDGTITITVTTMGRVMDTMRVMAPKNWGIVPSSDIAEAIADRHGFKKKIEVSKDDAAEVPFVQPADMSDYEYLHALAAAIDYEFFVESDTLYYRSREGAFNEPPRNTFYWWGDSTPTLLKSFKPVVKATKPAKVKGLQTDTKSGQSKAHVVTNKNVQGRQLGTSKPTQQNPIDPDDEPQNKDPGAGKHIVDGATGERKSIVRVDLESGAQTTLIQESASAVHKTADNSPTYTQQQVQALKRHYLDQLVQASAEFIGSPRIRAKVTYEFLGVGRRLSGLWYTTEVTHHISGDVYSTSASLKRGAYNTPAKKASKGTSATNNQGSTNTAAGQGNSAKIVKVNLETGEQAEAQDQGNPQAVPG